MDWNKIYVFKRKLGALSAEELLNAIDKREIELYNIKAFATNNSDRNKSWTWLDKHISEFKLQRQEYFDGKLSYDNLMYKQLCATLSGYIYIYIYINPNYSNHYIL